MCVGNKKDVITHSDNCNGSDPDKKNVTCADIVRDGTYAKAASPTAKQSMNRQASRNKRVPEKHS